MDCAQYDKDFPQGHSTIPNDGNGLLCGFFALIDSIKSQLSATTPPSLDELQEIRESKSVRAWSDPLGMAEDMNFHVELVAKVFEE